MVDGGSADGPVLGSSPSQTPYLVLMIQMEDILSSK